MTGIDPMFEGREDELSALDFVLSEGTPVQRQDFRARLDQSLQTALDVAEARDFVESFRSLDSEVDAVGVDADGTSPRLDVLMLSVRGQAMRQVRRSSVRRAAQTVSRRRVALRVCGSVMVAAMVLVGLLLGLRDAEPEGVAVPSWSSLSTAVAAEGNVVSDEGRIENNEQLASIGSPEATPSGLASESISDDPTVAEMVRFEERLVAARETLRHAGLTLDGESHSGDLGAYETWIAASNELAVLRREFRDRFGEDRRRARMRRHGFNPDVDGRVQRIADTVASKMAANLEAGTARPESAALVMRALLASGSTPKVGRHKEVVADLSEYLQGLLPDTDDEDPPIAPVTEAVVLGALMDLVILADDALASRVAERTTRLLEVVYASPADGGSLDSQLRFTNRRHADRTEDPGPQGSAVRGSRDLGHWATPVAAIGEAGRLFRLAPALGVDPDLAAGARTVLAAHLQAQAALRSTDSAALLAALRYGFGDLVNRAPLDRKLRRWDPSMLLPEPVVLLQVTWSQFPVRSGWSEFQSGLRRICTAPTPDDPGDAAAFLLCLGMHFAAPGQSAERARPTVASAESRRRAAL